MSPDSINQFGQVLGIKGYSNHHPFVHTMLFGLFYHIGCFVSHDMVVAVSFYTFFQMCFLAFSIFYFLKTLELFRIRQGILVAVTLFYALVPYHAVFSVTVWKDVPFAAVVLLLSCSMLRMMKRIGAGRLPCLSFPVSWCVCYGQTAGMVSCFVFPFC